jgi:glutathione S-transferase
LFPSIAKYLKHTPDGDDEDLEKRANLEESLSKLENHLNNVDGPFLAGSAMTLLDCSLAPKLYHLETGLQVFKSNAINVESQFPALAAYMQTVFARDSFQKTCYPKEVVTWGWGNARS